LAHPDVVDRAYERLLIDEARELIFEASRTPLAHSHRIFIIRAQTFTHEAQSALLKLFEDPPITARFYLIIPTRAMLLPTLRSRLSELEVFESKKTDVEEARAFLALSYGARLTAIERHAKDEDPHWFRETLAGLERMFESSGSAEVLRELIFVRSHIDRQGSSKKMLFDHLALTL
jgi:hypothetical protein